MIILTRTMTKKTLMIDNDGDGNYHDESNGNDDGILTFTMKMIQGDRRPFNFLPILAAASTGQVLSRYLLILMVLRLVLSVAECWIYW